MTMSNYLEDAIANALRGGAAGTSFTAPTTVYAKLHTGDPGEAGTSNASGTTTRNAIAFGASSGGVITNTADIDWTAWAAGSETITHISLWDASTVGNCLGSGPLGSSKAVANGDTFRLTSGGTTYTFD